MKFYPENSHLFSDILSEAHECYDEVKVYHLKDWNQNSGESVVVVDDSLSPRNVIENIYQKKINHLVQKNDRNFLEDLKAAATFISVPEQYFQKGFSLVSENKDNYVCIPVEKKEHKEEVISKISEYLEKLGSQMTTDAAISVVEELFMNALIDAPNEAAKNGIVPTTTTCFFELDHSNDFLQISCSDPYGSLNLQKLMKRLYQVYENGAGNVINLDGEGGAGIGCYLLFEQCSKLVFAVKPRVQTKVTGLIPLKVSNRRRSLIKKSLHGFQV